MENFLSKKDEDRNKWLITTVLILIFFIISPFLLPLAIPDIFPYAWIRT